jgi:hypothetical protein
MRDSENNTIMALTLVGGLFAIVTGLVIIARAKPVMAQQQPTQPTPTSAS